MLNRREFIQAGVAAVVVGGIGRPDGVTAAHGVPAERIPIDTAVYDRRYHDGLAFAAEAARLGLPTRGISGDVTDLWVKDLDTRWRRNRVPIAGLTTDAALFCLAELARVHRLRVVVRAEHQFGPGRVSHTIDCPRSALEHVRALEEASAASWARRMARLVTVVRFDGSPMARTVVVTSRVVPDIGLRAEAEHRPRDFQGWWGPEPQGVDLLVSWIIAPAG